MAQPTQRLGRRSNVGHPRQALVGLGLRAKARANYFFKLRQALTKSLASAGVTLVAGMTSLPSALL